MTQLDSLYDSLSRYQWWRRRLAFTRRGDGLEMHKRLSAPTSGSGPGAGCVALHDWLFELGNVAACDSVLDVGCGFGATLLSWAKKHAGRFVGLSLSPYQIHKARRECQGLQLRGTCEFRKQSYQDPIAGDFDLAVSVESLFHAPDLSLALVNIAGSLRPGGHVLLLEDMASDDSVAACDDARVLLNRWVTARLYSVRQFRESLARAGFALISDQDLTTQVVRSDRNSLDRRWRRLERLQRLTPFRGVQRVLSAFLGGIALERLYAEGRMNYRAMLATRQVGGQ